MTRCDKCHERDATVFLTHTVNDDTRELALCEMCAAPLTADGGSPQGLFELLHPGESFASLISSAFERVAATRPEYAVEAFLFVRDGVDYAVRSLPGKSRHVSAQQLLESLRLLAIERFGSAARDQLRNWGVTRSEDFGEIVFALIESGLFGKRPEDKKEDFQNGYDFDTAF